MLCLQKFKETFMSPGTVGTDYMKWGKKSKLKRDKRKKQKSETQKWGMLNKNI